MDAFVADQIDEFFNTNLPMIVLQPKIPSSLFIWWSTGPNSLGTREPGDNCRAEPLSSNLLPRVDAPSGWDSTSGLHVV